MSNPYQPRVQQKLAHCRLLLQQLQANDAAERQLREALLQGAAVHLAVAARLYLREVAYYLSVKTPERIFQVSDLADLLEGATVVEELKEQAWLPSLFAAEKDVLNPQLTSTTGPQLIAMSSVIRTVELTTEELQGFCDALSQLAEQQRLLFAEY